MIEVPVIAIDGDASSGKTSISKMSVSYTHLRAHET